MNDLFKKLAREADEFAAEKAQDGFTNYQLAYDRKYAELIVRECALQCHHNDDMDRIEKHFGIE